MHHSHSPQVEKYVSLTTRSPTAQPSTPSPSSRTTPETSWPIVTGGSDGNSSSQMWRSVPQMPAPTTSSTTWPARTTGSGRSVSATFPGPGAVFVTPSTYAGTSIQRPSRALAAIASPRTTPSCPSRNVGNSAASSGIRPASTAR